MSQGSDRDPRFDRLDHRPDLHGLVEGPVDTPENIVKRAKAIVCPDCNVNVFIEKDGTDPTGYRYVIAHDASCPWLAEHEKGH